MIRYANECWVQGPDMSEVLGMMWWSLHPLQQAFTIINGWKSLLRGPRQLKYKVKNWLSNCSGWKLDQMEAQRQQMEVQMACDPWFAFLGIASHTYTVWESYCG
ncbi:hypothetical protein CKAN_01060400 [Cinnamomum micranthum f. kanehirae]|uniref:Uncharacterized protein n=1 Tax=Cinnamomum micranthum f. kanehirae TaxID=337451 RepID=A0A443NTQ2_9MAGN|nr:hypothetical protein CKAN_01060400 [Cinnamomum micranthum f. kanehirae]